MRIAFRVRTGAQTRVMAEADIYFNADTPLHKLRLTGITVWRGENELFVTLPAKPNGPGAKTKFFDYIRATDAPGSPEARDALNAFKGWVLEEYDKAGRPGYVD